MVVRDALVVDSSSMPDLARLVDEVARTGTPRVLRHGGHDLAVLSPAEPKRRPKGKRVTQADIDAALATFGAWHDLDVETLLRDLDEARGDTTLPIVL